MTHFPLPDDHGVTRVPNAVMESLLRPNADVGQITFALRALWWLERSATFPKSVKVSELRADRTLVTSLGTDFDAAIDATCASGMFIRTRTGGTEKLMLNTVSAARRDGYIEDSHTEPAGGWDVPARQPGPADAFRAYEQNIGMLTPMIRESISQSLQDFTDEQITKAIRTAVENDARSWAFVKAVLARWKNEGIPDERKRRGRTGGSRIREADLRRYLERSARR